METAVIPTKFRLSTYQRNALYQALETHPIPLEVTKPGLCLRLCAAGLMREVAANAETASRRFLLTPLGLDRARSVADARDPPASACEAPSPDLQTFHQACVGRLYPTTAQLRAMSRIGGQCRALWNHWVALNRDLYNAERKFTFYNDMSASLPGLRTEERFAGLPHNCAQITLKHLDRALRESSRSMGSKQRGFPKFKRRSDLSDAFHFVGRVVKVLRMLP